MIFNELQGLEKVEPRALGIEDLGNSMVWVLNDLDDLPNLYV